MQASNVGRIKTGFTLVELLVVIAIIGILVGLLLPAVQQIREAARRTQCLNNLKQLGLAIHNYESAFGGFPEARWSPNGTSNYTIPAPVGAGKSSWKSWSVSILPFVEQQAVSDLIDQKQSWFSPANLEATRTPIEVFVCPTTPNSPRIDEYHVRGAAAGDYGCINEVHQRVFEQILVPPQMGTRPEEREGPLVKQVRMKMRDIGDGLSNTIMLAESAGKPEAWLSIGKMNAESFAQYTDDKVILFNGNYVNADGTGWADPDANFTINGASSDGLKKYGPAMINAINASEVFAFHPAGANHLFSDGSVSFIAKSIDARAYVWQCTRDGGEIVNLDR